MFSRIRVSLFTIVLGAIALSLLALSPAFADGGFVQTDLSSPADGAQYHVGGNNFAVVTVTATSQEVSFTSTNGGVYELHWQFSIGVGGTAADVFINGKDLELGGKKVHLSAGVPFVATPLSEPSADADVYYRWASGTWPNHWGTSTTTLDIDLGPNYTLTVQHNITLGP